MHYFALPISYITGIAAAMSELTVRRSRLEESIAIPNLPRSITNRTVGIYAQSPFHRHLHWLSNYYDVSDRGLRKMLYKKDQIGITILPT